MTNKLILLSLVSCLLLAAQKIPESAMPRQAYAAFVSSAQSQIACQQKWIDLRNSSGQQFMRLVVPATETCNVAIENITHQFQIIYSLKDSLDPQLALMVGSIVNDNRRECRTLFTTGRNIVGALARANYQLAAQAFVDGFNQSIAIADEQEQHLKSYDAYVQSKGWK